MANESKQGSGTVGLPPGTRIGKYEVKERLAIGGQAIIYKCYDSLLDRYVAIKQVSTHLAEDPKFLERFRKEAQILARLGARQPAIVSIYELLEDERGLFIVMEHIEGRTLEATLHDNPQPVETKAVLQIIWRLAGALHDVHSAGIIHRDIKPGNIIIGEGLRPKITDFGVAASITGQTSMLLGTTRYMAPELLSGQAFDGRADMYSLGFIAYEMLVGRQKFNEIFADIMRDKHSEALRWMKWHSNQSVQAPSLSEVNPAVPKALSDIVAKMMAKDPAGRFESMEALGRAIKGSFSPRGRAAEAPQPHKRHRRKRPPSPVVLAGDEGDELVVGGGPATAPIPKKQMTRRTKLFLLGSVVGVLVLGLIAVLIVKLSGERMAGLERSRLLTAADSNYYVKGEYAKALKDYQDLARLYGGTEEAARTSVMIPLSEAQVAVLAGDWDQAAAKEDEARTARDKLNQRAKGALLEWTRKVEEDLQNFSRYRTSMQDFDKAIKTADAAFAAQKYDEARKAVTDILRNRDLKPEQNVQLQVYQSKISAAEFKASIEALSKKAQDLSATGSYLEADKALAQAVDMMGTDKGKALPVDEQNAIKASLESRRRDLDSDRKLAGALADVQQARNANDRRGEITALEAALKIKADPSLQEQLKRAQSQLALSEGQELELARKYAEARLKYVESLDFERNAAASQGLDRVAGLEKRSAMVEKGNIAFDAGNFVEALKLYQEAYKDASIDDEVVKARIAECQYRIVLDQADRLAADKKYEEAFAEYEKLRKDHPKAEPIIDEREARLKLDQEYEGLMAEGHKAFEQGNFVKAIDLFGQAQKKKDTDDVKKALLNAKFTQSFSLGKARMDAGDKASALSYFKIASQYANDAQKKQVDELIKQIQESK